MEDRAPLARLAAVGLLGVALVLVALWLSRRLLTPDGDPPNPAPAVVTPGTKPRGSPVAVTAPADSELAALESEHAALLERRFELVRGLVQEQLASGEYEELVIARGDPVPGGKGLQAHNQIAPHPTDPDKQIVKQVVLPPELTPEHAALNQQIAALEARIRALRP